jgi:hypothetical protein
MFVPVIPTLSALHNSGGVGSTETSTVSALGVVDVGAPDGSVVVVVNNNTIVATTSKMNPAAAAARLLTQGCRPFGLTTSRATIGSNDGGVGASCRRIW